MNSVGRKPLWVRITMRLVWIVVCLVVFATGSLLGFVGRSEVVKNGMDQIIHNIPPQEVFGDRGSINVLVLGCDEDRYYAGRGHKKPGSIYRHASRSDMMMVAKIDFDKKRITGISIPRDLSWQVPGYRSQKINAYHNLGYDEGGPERAKELAKEAAEGVTGLEIDRVVVLNYEAFKSMVDMVGGVEVFVPRKMDYDDNAADLHIHLKKGRQVLDGYNAMCYVRYRHGDSDFKRQDRQKDLMMAIKERVIQNWQSSPEVADKTLDLMGKAFKADEMAALALFARKVGADNIKMDMVPVLEKPGSYDLELDDAKLVEKLQELHMYPETRVTYGG